MGELPSEVGRDYSAPGLTWRVSDQYSALSKLWSDTLYNVIFIWFTSVYMNCMSSYITLSASEVGAILLSLYIEALTPLWLYCIWR